VTGSSLAVITGQNATRNTSLPWTDSLPCWVQSPWMKLHQK
jgi:hypothetical protein